MHRKGCKKRTCGVERERQQYAGEEVYSERAQIEVQHGEPQGCQHNCAEAAAVGFVFGAEDRAKDEFLAQRGQRRICRDDIRRVRRSAVGCRGKRAVERVRFGERFVPDTAKSSRSEPDAAAITADMTRSR